MKPFLKVAYNAKIASLIQCCYTGLGILLKPIHFIGFWFVQVDGISAAHVFTMAYGFYDGHIISMERASSLHIC